MKVIGRMIDKDLGVALSAFEHDDEVYLMTKVSGNTTLEEISKAEMMIVIDQMFEPAGVPSEVPEECDEYPWEGDDNEDPVQDLRDEDIRDFVAANFGPEGEKVMDELKPKAPTRRGRPRKES